MLMIVLALILSLPTQPGQLELLDLAVQPHMYKTMDACIAAGKQAKLRVPNVKGWVCMYTTQEGTKS